MAPIPMFPSMLGAHRVLNVTDVHVRCEDAHAGYDRDTAIRSVALSLIASKDHIVA